MSVVPAVVSGRDIAWLMAEKNVDGAGKNTHVAC